MSFPVGRGVREKQWMCCKGSSEAPGCQIADVSAWITMKKNAAYIKKMAEHLNRQQC